MIELNRIYNEDCLEGMKRIPDGSVDLIVCDLPYGSTANRWDSVIPFPSLWEQYRRIIRENGAICLFGQRKFAVQLALSAFDLYRYDLVWQKVRPAGFLNAGRMPLCAHEQILVFYKKLPVYHPQFTKGHPYIKKCKANGSSNYGEYGANIVVSDGLRYPIDVLKFHVDKKRLHSTAKPVALIEWLVKTYSDQGDTVLDNCMGSGTTAVACLNTDRNFIGFELDRHYWEMSCERVRVRREELSAQQETHGQTEKKADGREVANAPGFYG